MGENIRSLTVPIELDYVASGTGHASTVGHSQVASVSHLGNGTLNATVTAVTDIADPAGTGGWTTLLSLTAGPYRVYPNTYSTASVSSLLSMFVDTNEDSGDSLRGQILIDGTVVWDQTLVGDNAGDHSVYLPGRDEGSSAYRGITLDCNTSFLVRVARKGTFADVGSYIKMCAIDYHKVSL